MEYLAGKSKYDLSYQELREEYFRFSRMTDEEFLQNIPQILHFTCVVGFLKEFPASMCLIDNGIIHELVHLLNEETREGVNLKEVREMFNQVCLLA